MKKLEEYLANLNDSVEVKIYNKDNDLLAIYDGRNSIPTYYNSCEVRSLVMTQPDEAEITLENDKIFEGDFTLRVKTPTNVKSIPEAVAAVEKILGEVLQGTGIQVEFLRIAPGNSLTLKEGDGTGK